MKDENNNWTPNAKRIVWSKAPFINILHPEYGKFDPCRAYIKEDEFGNQDSEFGWQIDHIIPERILEDAGVPQGLIDHPDNLRPMHWRNNNHKSNNFPEYSGVVAGAGLHNHDVSRDYRISRNQINVLRELYREYLDIPHPTILGQWQVMTNRSEPVHLRQAPFFDDIVTPSIHDLD